MTQGVDPHGFFDPHHKSQPDAREIDSPVLPVNHILSAMGYAHSRSGIQAPDGFDNYVEHAKAIARESLAGGTSAYSHLDEGPGAGHPVGSVEWYGVGGANNASTGKPQVGWKVPANVDQNPTALAHLLNTEANNIARSDAGEPLRAAVGGWVRSPEPEESQARGESGLPENKRTKTVVYDQTDIVPDRRQAIKMGRSRGEDAVFDAKNIKEISTKPRGGRK